MKNRILVVDDEEDVIMVLKARLESEGYEVTSATNGEEAIRVTQETKPDLIIMDVMMSPMNGFQACRQLKDDAECQNIPIILLTAKVSDSDKFWGEEAGADAYITKPYEVEGLLAKIKELLN